MFYVLLIFSILLKDAFMAPTGDVKSTADGQDLVSLGECPYHVGLIASKILWSNTTSGPFHHLWDNVQYCAGSIISKTYVLSAAHCFDQRRICNPPNTYGCGKLMKVFVRAGVVNSNTSNQDREIKNVIKHSNFIEGSQAKIGENNYDIALITVKTPFRFDDKIRPIPLVNLFPPNGTHCIVSGWGIDADSDKRRNLLKKAVYEIGDRIADAIYVTEDKIVSGIHCKGDSGGPVVCNGKLTGIVSAHFLDDKNPARCPKTTRLLTNVLFYKRWLKENGYKF